MFLKNFIRVLKKSFQGFRCNLVISVDSSRIPPESLEQRLNESLEDSLKEFLEESLKEYLEEYQKKLLEKPWKELMEPFRSP